MKRFFTTSLWILILLSCLPCFAEATFYEELGLSLDFSAIQEKTPNYLELHNNRVMSVEPFVSCIRVCYYALPREEAEALVSAINTTDDDAEFEKLYASLIGRGYRIASIIVTDAGSLEEAGIADPCFGDEAVTEFGTQGGYRYFCVIDPIDKLIPLYDVGEVLEEADIADIRMLQSELLKQLQGAELSEPEMSGTSFIGQTIRFDSVDLDGNPVSSADLFKDNEITMVNLWGTWCDNCLAEMGELAELHTRLREKGCGIVGVQYEHKPIEEVADLARQILAEKGVSYPNVLFPEGAPIFDRVSNYPTSFFVDSEGMILTTPVIGAYISDYESTIDGLLAGKAADEKTDTGVAEKESGAYRAIVSDENGAPVEGAVIQFCDEATCSFQLTDAKGIATFSVGEQKIYDVHVLMVPEGYVGTDDIYHTLETFSDVSIVLEKADQPGQDHAEDGFEATKTGVVFSAPKSFQGIKGYAEYTDFGDDYMHGEGIVEMMATYYPMSKEKYDSLLEKLDLADEADDLEAQIEILMQMTGTDLFSVYGINGGRGIDELIEYLLSELEPEKAEKQGFTRTEEEIDELKKNIRSYRYIEIGTCDGFTYILQIKDPERIRGMGSLPGFEDWYYKEFIALLEDADAIIDGIRLTGGVVLTDPIVHAGAGITIHFETTDLDGNAIKSEDLFAGHPVTMINLWGTWCGPCKRELPELEIMNRDLAEKNCQIIGFVTDATSDEKISEAKAILADRGVSYVNLIPFQGLSDMLPQDAWPTSYFVDENGTLIGEPIIGALLVQYRDAIDALLTDRE